MTCEELRDMHELYALGLLDGDEKQEIDAHLQRGCPTCRQSLSEAQAMNAVLLSSVPAVQPSSRLKRRLMASVGVQPVGWTWAAALAAACLLVVTLWLSDQERKRAGELAQTRGEMIQVAAERDRVFQALSFLNQPETRQVGFAKGPRGNVFLNPSRGILLISSNLPRLDPGRIFEMWVIPKGGAPRPAGLFQANPDGTAVHILAGALDRASLNAVAVTVEPAAGSPAPTSPIIIAASVAGP
jgi:anti-sigma-K factor RskA